jgi:hypothetical protein
MTEKRKPRFFSEEESQKVDQLKKDLNDLQEKVYKDFYWFLLRYWILSIIVISAASIAGSIVPISIPHSNINFENVAGSIIAPSITVNGLFLTLIPVLSFFLVNQTRTQEKEEPENFCQKCENRSVCQKYVKDFSSNINKVRRDYYHNLRSGVLRYTRTYVNVAILSLILIFSAYIGLSAKYFITMDILLLSALAMGIIPILSIALYEEPIKFKKEKS